MPSSKPLDPAALMALVTRVLDENRTMTVATLRPDGWPQATVVGFVHEELALYFVVARTSQKLANLQHDPRTSIAIGGAAGPGGEIRGLSMAARVEEVEDPGEIQRLNALVHERYPGAVVFAPRTSNCAVLRARPVILSLVDEAEGLSQPVLLELSTYTTLKRVAP
jgi:general stress protein 26